jgi:hypothetical protein
MAVKSVHVPTGQERRPDAFGKRCAIFQKLGPLSEFLTIPTSMQLPTTGFQQKAASGVSICSGGCDRHTEGMMGAKA